MKRLLTISRSKVGANFSIVMRLFTWAVEKPFRLEL